MATSYQKGEWAKLTTPALRKVRKEYSGYMQSALKTSNLSVYFDRKNDYNAIDKILSDRANGVVKAPKKSSGVYYTPRKVRNGK